MKVILCAVCEFPVEIGAPSTKARTFAHPGRLAAGDRDVRTFAIYGDPRCQRLLFETLAEFGHKQMDVDA